MRTGRTLQSQNITEVAAKVSTSTYLHLSDADGELRLFWRSLRTGRVVTPRGARTQTGAGREGHIQTHTYTHEPVAEA